jgi:hypothetical protein
MLTHYTQEMPYDLIVEPTYIVGCSHREDIIKYLIPSIKESLEDNKPYYDILKRRYKISERSAISDRIKTDLVEAKAGDNFFKILEEIDFSRLSKHASKKLLEDNNNLQINYLSATTFVPGDNIAGVEVIRYEPQYAIRIVENRIVGTTSHILPECHRQSEFIYKDKVIDS